MKCKLDNFIRRNIYRSKIVISCYIIVKLTKYNIKTLFNKIVLTLSLDDSK